MKCQTFFYFCRFKKIGIIYIDYNYNTLNINKLKNFMKKLFLVWLSALMMLPWALQAQSYFTEDFESLSSGLPTGWTKISSSGSVAVQTGSSYSCGGTHSLKFSGSTDNLVAMPALSVEISTVELTFSTRPEGSYSNCGSFQVGYVTSLTDATTFTSVATYSVSQVSGCQEFTVSFAGAPAGSYIAFRHQPLVTYYFWFLDDIDVSAASNCTSAGEIMADNITYNSADLSWTGCSSATGYQVAYSTSSTRDEDAVVVDAPSSTLALTNLTSDTRYYVWVRTICGTDSARWSSSINFETPVSCYPVEKAGAEEIDYDHALITWSTVDTIGLPPSSVQIQYKSTLDNSWTTDYTTNDYYNITNLTPTTTYTVRLRTLCDNDNDTAAVETFTFTTTPRCAPVQNARVSDVAGNKALLTWDFNETQGLPHSSVLIQYKSADETQWTTVTTTENYYFLTGLTPGSTYSVSIRTLCDNDVDTASVQSLTVSTSSCGEICDNHSQYSYYVPFHSNYNYGYSQTIYPASQLTGLDTITGIAFYVKSTSWRNRNIDVYIGHTNQTTLSTSNYIAVSDMSQKALACTLDVSTTGWVTIPFSTPFVYDRSSNIVVAVDNNTGGYGSFQFAAHDATEGNAVYWYSDYTNVQPSNPSASSDGVTTLVPDIRFIGNCLTSDCVAPMAMLTGVTTTTADLTWVAGDNETEWVVEYKLDADTVWTEAASITSTTYTVTDLNSSSYYNFRVGSICTNDTLYTRTISAWTECAATVAPYSENFETFNTNISPCWEFYSGAASDTITHITDLGTTSNGWKFSSRHAFGLTHASLNIFGMNRYEWMITPAIDLSSLNTPTLTFDMALTSYGSSNPIADSTRQQDDRFIVLVSTDNGATWNMSTATIWDNTATAAHRYDYISTAGEQVSISLAQYAGQTIRIAFYGESTISGGDNDLHIDNVSIIEPITCPKPKDLAASNSTASTIDLTWTETGSATDWIVEYVSGTAAPVAVNVSGTPSTTITGLESNTEYTFTVRAYCGAGDTSYVSNVATGRTACGVASLPLDENFDSYTAGYASYNYPDCWSRIRAAGSTYPYINTVNHSAPNGLYFYQSTYNGNSTSYAVSPEIDNSVQMSQLFTRFWAKKSSGYGFIVVGIMTNPDDTTTFVPVDSIDYTSSWAEYEVNFSQYTGTGHYVAFKSQIDTASGTYFSMNLDDIHIDYIPTCLRPNGVTVSDITATGANVTITPRGSETAWDVLCVADTVTDITDATWATITDTTHTLTGLTGNTDYIVYVRANCGDVTSEQLSTAFTTECDAVIAPYTENFAGFNSSPSVCWKKYSGLASLVFVDSATLVSGSNWFFNSSNVFSMGHPRLNNYGTSRRDWLVSPNINLSALTDPALIFDLALTDYGNEGVAEDAPDDKFMVIISTDGGTTWRANNATVWGDSTANYLYSEIPNTGRQVVLSLAQYAGQTIRIAFYGESTVRNGDNDLHIANFEVGEMPSCSRPNDIAFTQITYNSAIASWTGCPEADSYEIVYGTSNQIEATTNTTETVFDTTYSFQDLRSETPYYVWVRSICGGATSQWSMMSTFTTGVSCAPVVNARVITTTSNSAAIAWELDTTGGLPISSVMVSYKPSAQTTWTTATTTDNLYFISGLTSATTYNVQLRTLCDNDADTAVFRTLSFTTSVCGVEISGTGTQTSTSSPFHSNYNYGYSQTIYPASDLTGLDTIRGIAFYAKSQSSIPRTVDVYIANTTETTLSTTNFIPVTSMQQVAIAHSMNINGGWVTIPFSTPFVYDGTSNLVVAVDNNTGGYSSFSWRGHTPTTGNTVYWYQDGSDIQPSSPAAYSSSTSTIVPDITFMMNCSESDCVAPMLVTNGSTATTADLIWNENSSDYGWVVEYKAMADSVWSQATNTMTANYTVTGLTPSTGYEFRVGSLCGADTLYSNTAEAYTECAPISAPYSQNFDSFTTLPLCWERYSGIPSDTVTHTENLTSVSSGWGFTKTSVFGLRHAAMNIYGTSVKYWLVTPEIDLTALTNPALMFDLALTDWNNASQIEDTAGQPDDRFIVMISTDGGATWNMNNATVWNNAGTGDHVYNHISNTGDQVSISLAQFAGQTIRIAFYGESTVTNGDNDLHIDNLVVGEPISCARPSGLSVSATTENSTVISWTENGTATAWNIEYGLAGFAQGSGTTVAVTANPYTLTGLTAATSYDVYVQSDCGAGDASLWTGPVSFTTACVAVDLPFVELFNNLASGAIPSCWDNDETEGQVSEPWGYTAETAGVEGGCVMFDSYMNEEDAVNYLKTPVLNLTQNVMLTFYYMNPTGGDFSVYIEAAGTRTLLETGLVGAADWTRKSYDLSAYSNQAARIVFKGTSNYGYGDAYIYLDSVMIAAVAGPDPDPEPQPADTCHAPVLTVSNVDVNSATLSWTQEGTPDSWTLYYRKGTDAWTTVNITAASPYVLTDLMAESAYEAYMVANCDTTESAHSNTVNFTTLPDAVEDYVLAQTKLYPNPTSSYVTIANSNCMIEKIEVYDVYGKTLRVQQVNDHTAVLSADGLADGMYFVRIITDKGTVVKPFTKR